jgi:O-antigen/teichoic acid export membrane protein
MLGLINHYLLRYRQSKFTKDALILTLGTVVAQALPFLFYPIFGRIFSPSEFGLLATISAIIPILSILASGTYENGILLTKDKKEAAGLVLMILVRSFFILVALWIILDIFSKEIGVFLNESALPQWIFVAPLCAFATVVYNCFNEWCVSNKYFVSLSYNKIINTSSVALGKLGFGFSIFSGSGLILGDLFGRVISAASCVYRAFKLDGTFFSNVKRVEFLPLSKKYSSLQKLLMPDQILNYIGGSLHVFVIGSYFSSKDLGFFSLAASILTVPVTVISAAIKDVFRQRANQEFIQTGSCRKTYIKLFIPIAFISILLSIPIYFLLPKGFTILLGNQWLRAALFAQILLPMFVSNFISMSLGGILVIAQKLWTSLLWQIYTILISILSFYIGIYIYESIEMMLYFFMLGRTSAYIIYILLSYYYIVFFDAHDIAHISNTNTIL